MYNPFNGPKSHLFHYLTETEDKANQAVAIQKVLKALPDDEAKKLWDEVNMLNAAGAFGAILAAIFAPRKKPA